MFNYEIPRKRRNVDSTFLTGTNIKNLNWRRFCEEDLEIVQAIASTECYSLFGNVVLKNLIETSRETLVYEKHRCKELVSFIAFKTYPNLPALHIPSWTEWMEALYNKNNITSINTYFVHFATWCDPTIRSFDVVTHYKKLFEFLFTDHICLQYIIFILPSGASGLKICQKLFQIDKLYRLYPIGFGEDDNVQSLLVCDRSVFFEKIIIRRALAEDNDDLVEILDADCKELRELYGDFYIAEIVLNEDSTRKIIVAEHENRAIGMICVNSDVRLDTFYEYFDLDPYHGLRQHTDNELGTHDETDEDQERQTMFSSQMIEEKDLTIKEISEIGKSEENIVLPTTETVEDDKISADAYNLIGDSYDIFKKFAFNSSSSSESSIFEQDWTSDVTLLQTRVEIEIAEAKRAKKNFMSTTNLIWGQLSINSSTKMDFRTKIKHSNTLSMFTKQFESDSNCFIIELHGIRSDYDKRLTYLLLEAVFETFPNRDYCLITLPSDSKAFPGYDYFVKPVPRQCLQYEHELYLIYKYSFYGELSVRIANYDNLREITEFMDQIPKSKAVLQTIDELLANYLQLKFVITIYSNNTLIGVAILEVCNELYFLRTNFDIISFVNMQPENRIESNGFLKYFTLAPMYRRNYCVIIADFFRLTGFKRLFYFVKDSNKREPHTTILPYLSPIRPRRRIVYHPEKLGTHVPPDFILQDPPLIALYTLTTKDLHQRKRAIPTRIVVVGPSTTALSFLETLIFGKASQKFWYTNLVLVTPHGHFEALINENEALALARPAEVYYHYKYLQRLSLRTWVNVVHGCLVHIDKHNKYLTLTRDRQIKYDILYIFTGLEFGLPKLIPYTPNPPGNFLTVNSWHDAEILAIKLPLIERKQRRNVVVYGRTIEAYCILNYVIQSLQTNEKSIIFVLPPIESKNEFGTTTFNDEFVDLCIKNMLIRHNVKIYEGYQITKWETDKHDLIRLIVLESNFEICQLDCSFLISCEKKSVGYETIRAFNDSGLVFDGRLVINKTFQTNDPDIYAAGPVTKYKRILYADAYRHEYFNSFEIGRELALRLVTRFDPNFKFFVDRDFPLVVQKFKLPVIVNCVLPSNLNYLHINPPGLRIPHRVAILKDNYGVDIITGDRSHNTNSINYTVSNENTTSLNKFPDIKHPTLDSDQLKSTNYFRCHLDEFNLVTTIVCLRTTPIDVQNIINLYGKHEKLLNNLLTRYDANLLKDLFEFFQNSWWFYAVAHDRFSCLQCDNKQIFLDSMIFSDENLINDIICLFKKNNSHKLSEEKKLLIVGSYLYANQSKIEKNVLKFLTDYQDELPMFISPDNVHQFIKNLTLENVFYGIEELFIKASEL